MRPAVRPSASAGVVQPLPGAAGPVRLLAWSLAVLSPVTAVAAALWNRALLPDVTDLHPVFFGDVLLASCYPVVGAVVLGRQRTARLALVFLSAALVGPYLLAGQYAVLEHSRGDPGPLAVACAWLAAWGFVPYFVVLGLLLLLFPDGQPASPRWRRVVIACVAVLAVATAGRMVADTVVDASRGELRNPLGVGHWPNYLLLLGSWGSFVLGVPLGLISLLQRLRRSSGAERAQLQWLVLGGVALLACFAASFLLTEPVEDVVFGLALLAIPLSVLVAVVRHGLFDVELVLSRAIVLALLTGAVLASYAGVVALVGALTPDRRSAYALVAVVALLAATGRGALQAGVDRLLYGERRDPYAVVERIGRRLELATGPADAVEALVRELRSVLRLPYAGVLPDDGRLRPVEDGAASFDVELLPLTASGRSVGVLRVGHRSRGEEFTAPERAALTDVGRRLGALLEAGALTHEVQVSRERLVAAREEERRRLRHDLHDGVGPELAGMALQLDSLAARLADDPELAARAARLRDQMRRTVAEVRRAVDDLRPPALDQLGLAGALREQLASYGWVQLRVGELPPLPAAVEVAAYRIAGEAVANAVRHSRAQRCEVRVEVEEGWLVVEVVDDGTGMAPDAPPGVGLTSMRERAAEVGGRFEVGPGPDGGTVLRARLPRAAR